MKTLSHPFAVLFIAGLALLFGGCAILEPPKARSQLSANFDASRTDPIAVIVDDETGDWRHSHGRRGIYRQIEDEFIHQLMAKQYTLASRSDVHRIAQEGEFQRQSPLTAADAVIIGRILNVPAVLIVTLTELSISSEMRTFTVHTSNKEPRQERRRVYVGHVGVSARLLDIETGQILWIAADSGRSSLPGPDQLGEAVQPVAAAMARAFPDRYPNPGDFQEY